jgi:hypothetical protein
VNNSTKFEHPVAPGVYGPHKSNVLSMLHRSNVSLLSPALASGDELRADLVVSNTDPKRTFLSLVDARWPSPEFVGDVQQIRSEGIVAKVHLALSALPRFTTLAGLSEAERARLLSSCS